MVFFLIKAKYSYARAKNRISCGFFQKIPQKISFYAAFSYSLRFLCREPSPKQQVSASVE